MAAYHEDHVYTFDVENYSSKSSAKRMKRPSATLSSCLDQIYITDFLSKSHIQASARPRMPAPKCLEILSQIPVSCKYLYAFPIICVTRPIINTREMISK